MRFLVGAMMVTLALAGCVDDDSYVPDEADACVVTAADDYDSCTAEEEGLTRNEVAHRHDYWQDQERITILDYDKPAYPTSTAGIIACDGFPWYEVHPDDGFTVYQGTQFVEVTMSWGAEEYDNHGRTELWVKTANMDEEEFVAPIANGETITIEITDNVDNDLPHNLISAWEFVWYFYPQVEGNDTGGANCYTWHRSEFSVDVDIIRGLEIPLFPAHPDHWDGGNITEMTVLEETATIFYTTGSSPETSSSLGSDHPPWDPWVLSDGAIIPHDTETVRVELNVQGQTEAYTMALRFHGADTRERTALEPDQVEGTIQIYEIDVSRTIADGPYSTQSLWEFWLYHDGPNEDFRGEVSMTVTAYKQAA